MRAAGEAVTNRLAPGTSNITAANDKPIEADLRDFARRLCEYGDWGNVHFEAATGPREYWLIHVSVCPQCRAAEGKRLWERAHSEPLPIHRWRRKPKSRTIDLSSYGPEPEPAPVVELPVLAQEADCEGCGDGEAA